ncbi:MAG: branched-chain amino acid ABC transporter permease [Actinomycetota bacterium]
MSTPRSRGGPGRRLILLTLFGLVLLGIAAPHAAAQDEETGVGGTLRSRGTGPDGEDEFISGVELTVFDESGNEVGSAVTGDDGTWSVAVPGPGLYEVELNQETLPEGLPLRDPERSRLEAEVDPDTVRNVLFPLGERIGSDDNTIRIVQNLVDGIKFGLIIAMCAIGLSLIFGTTGLVNFAHGEMVTIGATMAFLFNVNGVFGVQFQLIIAAILAMIVAGIGGYAFDGLVWSKLRARGSSLISMLVVSIGFAIALRYLILFQFGGRPRTYADYAIQEQIDFGWFKLVPKDVVIIVLALTILVGVGLSLQLTRIGKAMRAVADNRDLAESSGIDVERVIRTVWITGAALTGLGGVLFGLTEAITWEMGFRLLLLMFAGVTLGGLGTAYGALFGSLIVGVFIQLSTQVIPADMKNVGALLMLVVILLVRPQGLLGRAERIG